MLKGMKWYTNGKIEVISFEKPDGFVPGRLKCSQETKEKISCSKKGIPLSEEHKKNISKSLRNNDKVSKAQKVRFSKEEERIKTSIATRKAMQRKEVKQKHLKGIRKRDKSEEFIKNCSIAQKNRFENPEQRRKISEATKRAIKKSEIRKKCSLGAMKAANTKNTSIELKVKKQLEENNISFKYQMYKFDRKNKCGYIFDFYLPKYKMVIECDGDYWHSLPKMKIRDKRKDFNILNYLY